MVESRLSAECWLVSAVNKQLEKYSRRISITSTSLSHSTSQDILKVGRQMNPRAKPGQDAAQRILIPELIQIICQDASPGVLARLSQAHSSFKEEAERWLYHRIYIDGKTADIFCLATLTENSKKALFVKSLTFHHNGDWKENGNGNAPLRDLTRALRNMHALTDLRIRLYLDLKDSDSGELSQVLK